jgi:nucleoside triphosphatase
MDMSNLPQFRIITVGLVWNKKRELLFCKKPPDRGVFAGQWGFPGGGIEAGETMNEALHRELREELGIEVTNVQPAFFKDGLFDKLYPDGTAIPVYMIFLLFHCDAKSENISINEEFSKYRWVRESEALSLDLNEITIDTLARIGPWQQAR